MLTGERRGVRRGMTVLGKIPAVPKPINLPSQRLENRGLDPNVELVPRGTVTWGNSGRSPPSSNGPWANNSQPSSPPVSSGAWGNPTSKSVPGAPAWVSNAGRPSSAGSTRPGSAGGSRPLSSGAPRPSSAGSRQDLPRPSSAGTQEPPPAQNAWGSGGTHGSQGDGGPPVGRPRSAESGPNARVSILSSELSNGPPVNQWGPGHGRKEDGPQSSRFTLTNGDFPTLGSEKNPNLRPQRRDDRAPAHEERPPSSAGSSHYDDFYPQGPRFHEADANGWPFRPPGGMMERDLLASNSWRRDGPDPGTEDHWRMPSGPYGPAGPPRFPNPEFVQRFGPPASYGRGAGDGFAPPFIRPERPGHFPPGMFPGPYDAGYYYPGPNYNMEEMMWGGPGGPSGPGPGRYFPPGPHEFRAPHGGMGPGLRPRLMPPHAGFNQDTEVFHGEHKLKEGDNAPVRSERSSAENVNRQEPKRQVHGRPLGQRDWGNDEPMDFSKPVFEKDPPASSKNHRVSFKTEPSTADVAILRKPQTPSPKSQNQDPRAEDKYTSNDDESSKREPGDEKVPTEVPNADATKIPEEKRVHDKAAGVLGKCPTSQEGSEDSSRPTDSVAGLKEGSKAKVKATTNEEWRPKQQSSDASKPDSENNATDSDNATTYDYEAQRAKMKEIAAQRARQLQKEEEERIKEQKAKALAKLEELNRRSAAVANDVSSSMDEGEEMKGGDDKNADSQPAEDIQEEIQGVKTSAAPNAKGDTVKKRDRRNSFKREQRSKAQQKREAIVKDLESERRESGTASLEFTEKESAGKGNEVPANVTKAVEETVFVQEPTASNTAQPQEKQVEHQPQPHKQSRQRGKPHFKQVNKPDVLDTLLLPDDGTSSKANGERPGRKYQRKYQPSKRPTKPQDVRVSDKVQLGEGMVWAPVRPNSAPKPQAPYQQPPHTPKANSDTWSAKDGWSGEAKEDRGSGRDHRHNHSNNWVGDVKEPRGSRDHRESNNVGWNGDGKEGRGDVREGRRDSHHNHSGAWSGEGARENRGGGRENHRNNSAEGNAREGRGVREQREHNWDSKENRGGQRESNWDKKEYRGNRDNWEGRGGRDSSGDVKDGRGGNHRRHLHQPQQGGDHNHGNTNNSGTGWSGGNGKESRGGGSNKDNLNNKGNAGWGGDEKEGRGREHNHPRRAGRYGGGRGGARPADLGNKTEKQRMVIDATGGAVPSQVAG